MDIPQKFRLTFRQGNYFRSFTYGFGVVVRDLGEWRPGFYTEFRCASREHSGLAWEAIFRVTLGWFLFFLHTCGTRACCVLLLVCVCLRHVLVCALASAARFGCWSIVSSMVHAFPFWFSFVSRMCLLAMLLASMSASSASNSLACKRQVSSILGIFPSWSLPELIKLRDFNIKASIWGRPLDLVIWKIDINDIPSDLNLGAWKY